MSTKKTPLRFEDRLLALEGLVQQLETSDLTLDELVRLHQKANKMLQMCGKQLDDANAKLSNNSESSSEFQSDEVQRID